MTRRVLSRALEKVLKRIPSLACRLRKDPSATLRNFTSYVNGGIESKLGHHSLEEIVDQVKGSMRMNVTEKQLNSRFSANVNVGESPFFRAVPLFIKRPMLYIANQLMRYYWLLEHDMV